MSSTFEKKSLLKRLTLLLLIQLTAQQCGNGCLQCTTDSENSPKCNLCDLQNFYALNSTSNLCDKVTIPNCQLLSGAGKCRRCNSQYYLVDDKCTLIPVADQIAFCLFYGQDKSCTQCQAGYHLKSTNDECLKADNPIANCKIHLENGCSLCEPGYKLSLGGNGCEIQNGVSNCLDTSFYRCDQCRAQYFFHPNIYLLQ